MVLDGLRIEGVGWFWTACTKVRIEKGWAVLDSLHSKMFAVDLII